MGRAGALATGWQVSPWGSTVGAWAGQGPPPGWQVPGWDRARRVGRVTRQTLVPCERWHRAGTGRTMDQWLLGCWLSPNLRRAGAQRRPAPEPWLTGCLVGNGSAIRRRSGGDWAGLPQLQERLQWAWGWAWCLGSATGPGSGTRASRRQPAARPSGLGPCRCWAGPKRKGVWGDCSSPRVKQPPAPRAPFFTLGTPVSPLFGGVFLGVSGRPFRAEHLGTRVKSSPVRRKTRGRSSAAETQPAGSIALYAHPNARQILGLRSKCSPGLQR